MNEFGEMTALVGSLSNNTEDYTRFYHNIQGEKVSHDRVHNLFGYNMDPGRRRSLRAFRAG